MGDSSRKELFDAVLCAVVVEAGLVLAVLGGAWGPFGPGTMLGGVGVTAHAFPGAPVARLMQELGADKSVSSAAGFAAQALAWALLFYLWFARRQVRAAVAFLGGAQPIHPPPAAAASEPAPVGSDFERRARIASIAVLAIAGAGYWFWYVRLPAPPVLPEVPAAQRAPLQERHGVLKLLWTGQFDALERVLGEAAQKYQRGEMPGRHWRSWFFSLEHADPAFALRFDEWVEQWPDSGWARLARGLFLLERAAAERGSEFARDTEPGQFRRMEEYLVRAKADLQLADQRLERCAMCMRGLITIDLYQGGPDARRLYDRALGYDPGDWNPAIAYFTTLYPQWGGSEDEMRGFIEESGRRDAALARHLQAVFHFRRGLVARSHRAAADEYIAALRIDLLPFALENLADIYMKHDDHDAAIPLLEKNLAVNDEWDLYTIEMLMQAYYGAGRRQEGDAMKQKRNVLIERYKNGN